MSDEFTVVRGACLIMLVSIVAGVVIACTDHEQPIKSTATPPAIIYEKDGCRVYMFRYKNGLGVDTKYYVVCEDGTASVIDAHPPVLHLNPNAKKPEKKVVK